MSEQKEERTWVICQQCEEGYSYHDCGEDTCCCLNPEPNIVCDTCGGKRGWYYGVEVSPRANCWACLRGMTK